MSSAAHRTHNRRPGTEAPGRRNPHHRRAEPARTPHYSSAAAFRLRQYLSPK